MILGRQTGSLCNAMMESRTFVEPVVGMGATLLAWTDRYPATVVEWDAKKQEVLLFEDKATAIGSVAFTENQSWAYEFDAKGNSYRFKFKNGRWRQMSIGENGKYRLMPKGTGHGLMLGERDKYYDPCF